MLLGIRGDERKRTRQTYAFPYNSITKLVRIVLDYVCTCIGNAQKFYDFDRKGIIMIKN